MGNAPEPSAPEAASPSEAAAEGLAQYTSEKKMAMPSGEGGFAIGYRRMVVNGFVEDGLELGVPHRYALWRDGLRTLSLDLRPMLLLGSRVEPSLEAAFLFPLGDVPNHDQRQIPRARM